MLSCNVIFVKVCELDAQFKSSTPKRYCSQSTVQCSMLHHAPDLQPEFRQSYCLKTQDRRVILWCAPICIGHITRFLRALVSVFGKVSSDANVIPFPSVSLRSQEDIVLDLYLQICKKLFLYVARYTYSWYLGIFLVVIKTFFAAVLHTLVQQAFDVRQYILRTTALH